MKRCVWLCLWWVGCLFPAAFAQEGAPLVAQARNWEALSEWASAAACYEQHLSEHPSGETDACWHYAHCLRMLYEYRQAEAMYRRVWRQDSLHYPDALFYLATVLKNNAGYAEAERLFARYMRLDNAACDTLLRQRARMEVQACAWAQEALRHPQPCSLERLPRKVNSPHSESNARRVGDSLLYFTSLQPVTQSGQGAAMGGYYASRIYVARVMPEGIGSVQPLPARINHPKYHNGNICFNASHTRLYLTRSPVGKPAASAAEIWTAEFREGKWQKPYRLGEPVNLPGTVSTQPYVVGTGGVEVLYFVSDRPGGAGGLDLWYALAGEDGQFRTAVNLGRTVNTPGNEMTPFYDSTSHRLYFSSDGYPGLGGYDVFVVEGGLNQWISAPRNLGYPLNSPANDVHFVCSEDGACGYLASNRQSERALTDAVCCNDLYYFEFEGKQERAAVSTDTVWCPPLEHRSTEASRKALSMLPLTLYFHNDEPDPKCENDTTASDYHSTLALYLALRPKYIEAYAEGLQGAAADSAREQIRRFFTDSLERGYQRLRAFLALLREDLESGSSVSLTVEGHASPLFSDQYNMHLSSRRIHSLWNSLVEYDGGVFLPYLRSGRLYVAHDPRGRRQAKPYVSDNPNDQRNSVYSVAAALERRIQIVGYASVPEKTLAAASGFRLPAEQFVWRKVEGAERYCRRIEFRNDGADTLRIAVVCDAPDMACSVSHPVLPPEGSVFLTVEFGASLFDIQPERKAVLRLQRGGKVEELPLSFVFFKQK